MDEPKATLSDFYCSALHLSDVIHIYREMLNVNKIIKDRRAPGNWILAGRHAPVTRLFRSIDSLTRSTLRSRTFNSRSRPSILRTTDV